MPTCIDNWGAIRMHWSHLSYAPAPHRVATNAFEQNWKVEGSKECGFLSVLANSEFQ